MFFMLNRGLAKKLQKMRVPASLLSSALQYEKAIRGESRIFHDEETGRLGLSELRKDEQAIASHLRRLASEPLSRPISAEVPDRVLSAYPSLHENQIAAVRAMCESPVSILTGGPGTGKTHTTKVMLQVLTEAGLSVRCAAPTGKAAQRMRELTGFQASTIHRLIASLYDPMTQTYQSIKEDVVVIDESSMMSVDLAAMILQYVRSGHRLVIIGDVDQLPSIGAGRVLYDVIASGKFPVSRLTKIFRQASDSRIPWVAASFNEGKIPKDLHEKGSGFVFIPVEDAADQESDDLYSDLMDEDGSAAPIANNPILASAVEGMCVHLPAKYGFSTDDIVVLAPMRVRACGVNALNAEIQRRLNPCLDPQSDVWILNKQAARLNDRVIHKVNEYDLGVFNGEVGKIVDAAIRGVDLSVLESKKVVSTAGEGEPVALVVRYPDPDAASGFKHIGYTTAQARVMLDLAYASTVHAYQGSQAKAVLFICTRSQAWMNVRSIVYTALTRATEYVGIIGQEKALADALRNMRGVERRTQLQNFLQSGRTHAAEHDAA